MSFFLRGMLRLKPSFLTCTMVLCGPRFFCTVAHIRIKKMRGRGNVQSGQFVRQLPKFYILASTASINSVLKYH